MPSQHQDPSNSAWSASSDKQLGSPATSDRVFPIRSVVNVDASQTPYMLPGRNSSEQHDYFPSGVGAGGYSGADITNGPSRHRYGHLIPEEAEVGAAHTNSKTIAHRGSNPGRIEGHPSRRYTAALTDMAWPGACRPCSYSVTLDLINRARSPTQWAMEAQ